MKKKMMPSARGRGRPPLLRAAARNVRIPREHASTRFSAVASGTRETMDFAGTGILIEEPNPTGSRPSDLIGLCKQHMRPRPPNISTEAIEATRRRQREERRTQNGPKRHKGKPTEALRGQRGGDQRSLRSETTGRESASTEKPGREAARPTPGLVYDS